MEPRTPRTQVYPEPPAARPAPLTQTGLLGWVRQNLLASWLDVFLTTAFLTIVAGAAVSFVVWAVTDANWWSVAFNFRQFMVGGYEAALEWRLALAVVFAAVALGMAAAVWVRRVAAVAAGLIAGTLLLLWGLPAVVNAAVAIPPVYLAAGNAPVVIGNFSDVTRPRLAFTGRAGEAITVRIAPVSNDEQIAALHGFMDPSTNGMRIVAQRRLEDAVTRADLEAQLAAHARSPIPLLTAGQVERMQTQLGRLEPTPAVSDALHVNQAAIDVRVLDAEGNLIGQAGTLDDRDDLLHVTLPADGWYILETSTTHETSITLLEVTGIHTLLQVSVLQPGGGFVSVYTRMVDYFQLRGVPLVDNRTLPFFDITRNQYWGQRDVGAYLRLYVAPFLALHAFNATVVLLAGVAGYWIVRLVSRVRGAAAAARVGALALIATPVVIWVMAAGLTIPDILNLSTVAGAIVAVMCARAIGAQFGRTPIGLALIVLLALAAWTAPLLTFNPQLDMVSAALAAFSPAPEQYGYGLLAFINFVSPALIVMFWLIGHDSYGVSDEGQNRRQIGLYTVLTVTCLSIPLLLARLGGVDPSAAYPDWFLRLSDQRLWGGLLLTFILTIYGITFSFPIGILLALGRRSNLPAISIGCTLYIELIRGSPFITILFLGQLFIPLINPEFATIPGTIRALVAVILFSAAYLAENVRGGLQSLPPGQTEAGVSLGLSGWQIIYYITLPQALRAVIPAILGSFVSLFKDTSLVAIVGLTDLTGFVNSMVVQPAFSGTRAEGLLFVTLIYFGFSYVMSYVSRLLEASGSGSARRI